MSESAGALLARYLRQRVEFGEREIFLTPGTTMPRTLGTGALSVSGAHPALGPGSVKGAGLDAVREQALACTACQLAGTRANVVFGEGPVPARLMVVGEAPGADEDRTGRPFVGRAGRLLDRLLLSAGIERDSVYICNVLKCRPPKNRNPEADEMESCAPFLLAQIHAVRPVAILACGNYAARRLLGSVESIGKLRARSHEFEGMPVVPTYHPAALLRTPSWIPSVWRDLQKLRLHLDS